MEKKYFGIDYHDGFEGESFMTLFEEGDDQKFKDDLKAFIEHWRGEGRLVDDDLTDFVESISLTEATAVNKYSRNGYRDRVKLSDETYKENVSLSIINSDIDEFLYLISRGPSTKSL